MQLQSFTLVAIQVSLSHVARLLSALIKTHAMLVCFLQLDTALLCLLHKALYHHTGDVVAS
jgi:hypothetical protein